MDNSHIPEMTVHEARKQLKVCLETGRIIPTYHFREELSNEQLTIEDAYMVLRSGNIFSPPEEDGRTGEFKYRIEGHEPGGQWIVIVFCFKRIDTANLITIFSVSARRRTR